MKKAMKFQVVSLLYLLSFSIKDPFVVSLYNAALYKPAWQSSTHEGRIAEWGNDGSRVTFDGSTFRGSETLPEDPAWWMVDLRGQYVVEQIVLTNRNDDPSGFNRLRNFQIDVFRSDPRQSEDFLHISGDVCFNRTEPVLAGTFTWNCTTPVTGRYVRIIRYANDHFNIIEFGVMAHRGSHMLTSFSRILDSILNISPVVLVNVSSPNECVQRCLKLRTSWRCTSFNWVTSNKTCQLLSIDTRIKNTILSKLTSLVGAHYYMEVY